MFYYALIAIDDAGNKSPISNVISVYIHEALTTTTTTTTMDPNSAQKSSNLTGSLPSNLQNFYDGNMHAVRSSSDVYDENKHTRVYIATGIVCGLLMLSIMIIILILVRVRTKRAQYNTDACDSYRAYEPSSNFGNDKNSNGGTLVLPSNGIPTNSTVRGNMSVEHNTTKNLSN